MKTKNPVELVTEAFKGELLPRSCQLVGYTWLVSHFDRRLPVRKLSCISSKRLSSKREKRENWIVFDSQIQLEETVGGMDYYIGSIVLAKNSS